MKFPYFSPLFFWGGAILACLDSDPLNLLIPENTDYLFVKGWLAAADDSVIGCMPSPCYGELANGTKQKASSAATILHTLEKVHVLR
jgi:hypothetical protein